jgi:hypothetical protein
MQAHGVGIEPLGIARLRRGDRGGAQQEKADENG